MSHMTCHDHFVGLWIFHSSHIHFRVHIRVCIVSCDTIKHGMTWNSIQLCLHTGLTLVWDSHSHVIH